MGQLVDKIKEKSSMTDSIGYVQYNFRCLCKAKATGKAGEAIENLTGNRWVTGTYIETEPMLKQKNPFKGYHRGWIIPLRSVRSNGGYVNLTTKYPVDETTVCRYAGLKDSEWQDVFEWDIIEYAGKKLIVQFDVERFQWVAKEQNESYKWFDGKSDDWDAIELGWLRAEFIASEQINFKIVGNVIDTPVETENIEYEI